MRNTTILSKYVTALFSAIREDGTTSPLDIATVGIRAHNTRHPLVDVHRALASYLSATDSPAGIYLFQLGGETRMDRWDGRQFPGCNCVEGKDPECGMYACWGVPAQTAKAAA